VIEHLKHGKGKSMQHCTNKSENPNAEPLVLLRRVLNRISNDPTTRRVNSALIRALDNGHVEVGVVWPETQKLVLMLAVPPDKASRLLESVIVDPIALIFLKMLIERKFCIIPPDGTEDDVAFGVFGFSEWEEEFMERC
jgi:hypothetical protein